MSPQHLEHCSSLILHGLRQRPPGISPNVLMLGAGACTEIPLLEITRGSDEVVLADLDLASMQQAARELPTSALRKRLFLLQSDISGGVSTNLQRLLENNPGICWSHVARRRSLTPLQNVWSNAWRLIHQS